MSPWLRLYAFLICYRFRKYLRPLQLPPNMQWLTVEIIQRKAAGSLTSAGVFFGLSVVLLGAFLGEIGARIKVLLLAGTRFPVPTRVLVLVMVTVSAALPYLVIRQERLITNARVDGGRDGESHLRRCRRSLLWILFLLSASFYGLVPWMWPSTRELFRGAFAASAFLLIVSSVFFLLFSVEFYDSASSWRGRDAAIHFHLATLAATSYLFGISLALVGGALLLCLVGLRLAGVGVLITLTVVTAMAEIQRSLWHLRENKQEDEEEDPVSL